MRQLDSVSVSESESESDYDPEKSHPRPRQLDSGCFSESESVSYSDEKNSIQYCHRPCLILRVVDPGVGLAVFMWPFVSVIFCFLTGDKAGEYNRERRVHAQPGEAVGFRHPNVPVERRGEKEPRHTGKRRRFFFCHFRVVRVSYQTRSNS